MATIFEARFERTLDRLRREARPGQAFEAWTFDDAASRRAAERALARRGIAARIRSAYKPLLHAFLEEIDLRDVAEIETGYPVHAGGPENRFRLEAYPLAAMVGARAIRFIPLRTGDLHYHLRLHRPDDTEERRVFAPNRLRQDAIGETNLSPTGWLRREGEPVGERIETDYEALFEATVAAIAAHPFGAREPFFEELNIRATLPADDEPLAVGHEATSLCEALHYDLTFSLLELFGHRSGRPFGDRRLQPGQIVPEVVRGGEVGVCIETRAFAATAPARDAGEPVDTATRPPAPEHIAAVLGEIGGKTLLAETRAKRPVLGRSIRGSDSAVMISAGGQHANETTGIVGALRAARRLMTRSGAHFTVAPLENPDGYEIHRRLCLDNPRHMHHAARYTAFGDDLEYRAIETRGAAIHETAIRLAAQDASGALLHVNLHGYPAHEWTRPLSGYTPRRFAMWTIPKGFFLIVHHHADWAAQAEALTDRVTAHLAALPGLVAQNRRQIALYEIHAGDTGFRMVNGVPVLASASDRHRVPVTLITEYPDETISGYSFATAPTAQMETVLAAYDAWQAFMRTA